MPRPGPQILDVNFLLAGEPATIPLGFLATCTVAETVGDPVIFHATNADQVERLTSNSYDTRLVVGVIHSKTSPTQCFVVTMGILEGITSGLTQGQPIWISPTGTLTTTKPTTGHLQVIGNAVASTDVSVAIESRKTILT
jgi:hypothetical protein